MISTSVRLAKAGTKKYVTNEDNNIIQVHSTSIVMLIPMSDTFFGICQMRDVLLL